MMKTLFVSLNVLSALAAFVAAVLWWRSSVCFVRSDYDGPMDSAYLAFMGGRDSVGMTPSGERFDVIATLNLQSRHNAWAAGAAAIAAVLQAANTLLATWA